MKGRFFGVLVGLSSLFLVFSQALIWPLTMKVADGLREKASSVILYSISQAPTVDEAFRQMRETTETIGIRQTGLQVVAYSEKGKVSHTLFPDGDKIDTGALPALSLGEVRREVRSITEFTVLSRATKIENVVFVIRFPRFGIVAQKLFIGTLLFNLWIVLGSSLFSVVTVFTYFRARARDSYKVFGQIVQGNLKARFSLSRIDEVGRLMLLFNRMADEIEGLIGKLEAAQTQRVRLLQEISHDTRTPLTAARMSLEMIQTGFAQLDDKERRRCIEIAHHEVLYLQYLIDDLFFLAEMDQPNYQQACEDVDLAAIVKGEIEQRLFRQSNINWVFDRDSACDGVVWGTRRLLIRLIRNAFDNAEKFAATKVTIRLLSIAEGRLSLQVENDGGAITEDHIRAFGVRRPFQREAGSIASGRSLGLGSVIMKKIAALHCGQLRLRALPSGGALLEVSLSIKKRLQAA